MNRRLSILIPSTLVIVALCSSYLIYLQEEKVNEGEIRHRAVTELKGQASGLQKAIQASFHDDKEFETALALSLAAAGPGTRNVLVTDLNHRIRAASHSELNGGHAATMSAYYSEHEADDALRKGTPLMHVSTANANLLQGYFPLIGEAGPDRHAKLLGTLYVEHDLKPDLDEAAERTVRQTSIFAAIILASSLLVALLLHLMVTQRVRRLSDSAAQFAAGNLSVRANLKGKNELSRLGKVFDGMAQKVSDNIAIQNDLIMQLDKERALLTNAQRIGSFGSWDLDLASGELIWSQEIFRIFEIDQDRFGATYEAFLNAIHPEDRELVNSAYTESVANRTAYQIVHRLKMPDGRVKWVLEHGRTYYEGDRPVRSTGTIQDITSFKMLEIALKDKEEKLESILNASGVAVSWANERGEIEFTNATFTRMFGYTLADIPTIEQWFERAYPDPAYRTSVVNQWNNILSEGLRDGRHILQPLEINITCKDGSVKTVVLTGSRAASLLIASFSDITPIRLAEQAAREKESLYRAAIATSVDGVWMTNNQGELLEVNQAYINMSGYSREELIGKHIADFEAEHSAAEIESNIHAIAVTGHAQFETTHRRKDGSTWPVQVTISRDSGGSGYFFAFFTDLTERRQKDAILQQQARLATMGEMIGNIAHQWRQPINALGLILFDLEDAANHGLCDAQYLHGAVASSSTIIRKMSNTIDDFKNFFKTDNSSAPFSMGVVVRESLGIMEAALRHHHIAVHVSNGSGIMVQGRANDFSQCMINLLANAKDAILQREIAHGEIWIEISDDPEYGIVSIEDNALGIPPHILPRIFDPYFTTKADGLGIGLYMTHIAIERNMHGHLQVENTSRGARFIIKLPKASQEVSA